MKFVYFGYDFMIGVVSRLLADGHQLAGVFTFPCDNVFNFNADIIALAAARNIPLFTDRPTPGALAPFLANGVTCFLAAGYPYKIPPIDAPGVFTMNVHPSLLPKGRGLMPTPYILMDHPEAAGLTFHKMTDVYDAGDILDQVKLPLQPRETVETYSARITMAAPAMASRLLADLPDAWARARPQDESRALHFPPPPQAMRLLDWAQPVARIDQTARAFGRYGSLAQIEGALHVVYAADMWREDHAYLPGTVAARLSREIVVAAKDGYVLLKDFQTAQV